MHRSLERAGAWCGLVTMALFGIAFWAIADFVPPLSPNDSARDTAAVYDHHNLRIRLGLGLIILFAVLFIPFLAVLVRQVNRIEGSFGVLTISQLIAAVIFPVGFIFPSMVAVAAGFRTKRSPEITQALNDVFWLMFVGVVGTLILQAVVLVIATFLDKRTPPVFPRWFGYFNAWYAVLATPGCAVVLFHSGPLAWNGVFAFWVPLVAFSAWLLAVTFVLLRAVDSEAAEIDARGTTVLIEERVTAPRGADASLPRA